MNIKKDENKFICKRCNKSFDLSEKADKETRDGKILCKKCMIEYEISWDEFEDWIKDSWHFDNMVKVAEYIAIKAHEGQVDKSGKEYINHPLTVASLVDTDEEKIVALLHDVVEDSDVTIKDLAEYGFSSNIIKAINAITKKKGQTYDEYIEKLKTSSLAVKVKIADLTHNSDLSRISSPTQKDKDRTKKYARIKDELVKYIGNKKKTEM